jgi:hypothetical protein
MANRDAPYCWGFATLDSAIAALRAAVAPGPRPRLYRTATGWRKVPSGRQKRRRRHKQTGGSYMDQKEVQET